MNPSLPFPHLESLPTHFSHAFVTGAGGFLGKVICKMLVNAGIKVTGFARGEYPDLCEMGVMMHQGDIADYEAVSAAIAGCDVVFHVASKAGVWGSREIYYKPNVIGCINMIEACKNHHIDTLIYTSTPSVTFDGIDESGIDESAPYASRFLNHYAETKATAEAMVLAANGEQLKTVALRPHLIWGPEDGHLVPRVIARAKAGKLKLVGSKDKLVDTIYVDNAAYAHLLAAIELAQPDRKCAGKPYYLSNDQPITMAEMLNLIIGCVGLPKVESRVPAPVAYAAGLVLETVYRLINKKDEPIMTRFVAKQLSTAHYFDISAAKRDFNYQAVVSIEEGIRRLQQSL
jgi:nucleoside-diphosphate-sugar epimerase